MENTCAVVLAAGDGKRMKSARPKVLAEVLFKPMFSWVLDHCHEAGITRGCAVLGAGAGEVAALLPRGFDHCIQTERKGTGHAASMARDFLRSGGFAHVVVLGGDAPFVTAEILRGAFALHQSGGNGATVISAQVEEPFGYGRILREGDAVRAIVEERDATPEQRAIREINSGALWFSTEVLLEYFDNMASHNAQGEYYITDALEYVLKKGGWVGAYQADSDAALGANDRMGLMQLNAIARERVLRQQMENGVNIPFGDGVVIGCDVVIGPDTTILPGTILKGRTVIGSGCEIGPNSHLEDAVVGEGCRVISTYIDRSTLEDGVKIGPMSNVRPDCVIGAGVKIGDFVEVKNSTIGPGTSVAHLTYVGDSDVGGGCNFGCGVVTVNYDGNKKHRTVIGNNCFIGCNTNLVAPVRVGDRVYAAAGTTVTEDIPADALVIGRARQVVKEDWALRRGLYKKK